jgi:thiamine phosphate synthase YjbQ (UPF0047 family)
MELVHVATREHTEFIDITDRLSAIVDRSGIVEGLVNVQVLHTMTAVAIDDGNVRGVPLRVSALPLTTSVCLNVADGRLVLGRSQRVLLVELDGPQRRVVSVVIVAAATLAGLLRETRPTDESVGRLSRSRPGEMRETVGRVSQSRPGEMRETVGRVSQSRPGEIHEHTRSSWIERRFSEALDR